MYYRLKEPYAFRGWKQLPYAVCAERGPKLFENPDFFDRETFLNLLYFNGQEEVRAEELPEMTQRVIAGMLKVGMLEASEERMEPLQSWQRYHVYPSRRLESVHWAITGKCNFRCRHCLVSAPTACHPQLPFEDCLKIMDQIAECGIHQVDITGGEPLVRQDYREFFEELAKRSIYIRTFFTNASLLTAEVLDALESSGHHPAFQLSFDGLGHHDWLRGVEGAEKQADAAFRLLKERNFLCSAAMCIHKGNQDSLRDTVNYLAGLGVVSLNVNAPQELGVWKEYSDCYALSYEEEWEVYRSYIPRYFEDGMPINLSLDGFFFCRKGEKKYKVPFVQHVREGANYNRCFFCESVHHSAHIDPEGRLVPCMGFCGTFMEKQFPSLLEEHMGKLTLDSFYAEIADTRMEDLIAADSECAGCEHLRFCGGGCMVDGVSKAEAHPRHSPSACYFHKHIGEKAVRTAADAAIEKYCAE